MIFIYGLSLVIIGVLSLFLIFLYSRVKPSFKRGFWNISDPSNVSFIPLTPNDNDFIGWAVKHKLFVEAPRSLKRFSLYQGHRGVFVENKSYGEGCLKNRKLIRKYKTNLNNQDVLDFDKFSLMYYDTASANFALRRIKRSHKDSSLNTQQLSTVPILQPINERKEPILLDKNVIYIGRSQNNDIVIRQPNVSKYQAKILINLGKVKLVNVCTDSNTFVNGKRINERYLSHKDEVAFDNQKFKFLKN